MSNISDNSNNTKNDSISFPSPGIEKSFPLADGGLMVRHGSSLCLMSQVCEFLANPVQDDSFNYVDPTKDHHKWARRGMQLYYAAVVDPSSPGTIQCALRAATQGILVDDEESSPTRQQQPSQDAMNNKKRKQSTLARRKRFLIDYVYTAPAYRDKGIAGLLVRHVLELAQQQQQKATCYVLSIEDSCVYWMEKHQFFLCQSPGLNQLLNLFPDTHLLKKKKKEENKQANDSGANDNDDDDDDSDEEDALLRVQEQGLSSSSSSDSSDDSNSSTATQTPPESFQQPLALLLTTTSQQQQTLNGTGSLALCLSTLAVLIRNAMQADAAASSTSEEQDEGNNKKDDPRKRCKVRINNPQVHKRVFSFGQDAAMQILQACGFDLEVDDEGDAILHFHASSNRASWLPAAIAHLELEANKRK